MAGSKDKICGCKGIRTCLLCESQRGISNTSLDDVQSQSYKYCPYCNLCWPDDEETNLRHGLPLYLGKLRLILDFITKEEEASAVSAIDAIQWMPSQSGRRKQDFGPKVNFKKKKIKVGNFTGFPKFTENILQKFKNVPELLDFQAIELCHLEYSPERGSSIDPHVDDFWLWGERLVTVNLGSSTVLTLVPFSDDECECREQSQMPFHGFTATNVKNKNACNHFQNFHLLQNFSKSLFVSNNLTTVNNHVANNIVDVKLNENVPNPELATACNGSELGRNLFARANNHSGKNIFQSPVKENLPKSNVVSTFPPEMPSLSKCFDITSNEDGNVNRCHMENNSEQRVNSPTYDNGTRCDVNTGESHDMCSIFRRGCSRPEVAVRIVLPPRSLLILAGCARYNWYHEIKRQDVVSRRLAMTFRELTPQFLDGGKESDIGKELLSIANNLCDFF